MGWGPHTWYLVISIVSSWMGSRNRFLIPLAVPMLQKSLPAPLSIGRIFWSVPPTASQCFSFCPGAGEYQRLRRFGSWPIAGAAPCSVPPAWLFLQTHPDNSQGAGARRRPAAVQAPVAQGGPGQRLALPQSRRREPQRHGDIQDHKT